MRPIAIDLFSGAGGLSLGFERAGFDISAAVELDPIHAATHKFNFPNGTTICRSVRDVTGAEIRRLAGIGRKQIAVVCGGAPCQGFSLIGQRVLDDPRNELVYHFVRLVLELKPLYFVFENVKGLTIGKHRQFLDEVIEAFREGGYNILLPYKVLNASNYGVPQNRHRLFLIGARAKQRLPEYPAVFSERVSVEDAIGDLPEADRYEELLDCDSITIDFDSKSDYARRLRGLDDDSFDFGYHRLFDRKILTSSLRTAHTEKSRKRFLKTPFGKTEPISRFHKLDPNGVCNTLRAGTASDRGAFTSPRPIHPHSPRVITNREAARLHSYPDWFRFHVTKWHGFRQIGNSVPPLLAQAVAGEIMKAMRVKPKVPYSPIVLPDPKLLSYSMKEAAAHFGVSDDVIPKRKRVKERMITQDSDKERRVATG